MQTSDVKVQLPSSAAPSPSCPFGFHTRYSVFLYLLGQGICCCEVKKRSLGSLGSLAMMFNKPWVTGEVGRRGKGPVESWAGLTDAQEMIEKLTEYKSV